MPRNKTSSSRFRDEPLQHVEGVEVAAVQGEAGQRVDLLGHHLLVVVGGVDDRHTGSRMALRRCESECVMVRIESPPDPGSRRRADAVGDLRRRAAGGAGGPQSNAGKTTLFNALDRAAGQDRELSGRDGDAAGRNGPTRRTDGHAGGPAPAPHSLEPVGPDGRWSATFSGQESGRAAAGRAAAGGGCHHPATVAGAGRTGTAAGLPSALVLTMIDEWKPVAQHRHPGVVNALGIGGDRRRGTSGRGSSRAGCWRTRPVGHAGPGAPAGDPEGLAGWIDSVTAQSLHVPGERNPWTERVDRVLPASGHRNLMFALVMVAFFQVIFAWAAPLTDGINNFFGWLGGLAKSQIPNRTAGRFISDRVIGGVGSVLGFVPQIILLFVMISFLENVGYMSQVALVMDRVMGAVGLEGHHVAS